MTRSSSPPAPPKFPAEVADLLLPGPAGVLEVACDLPDPQHARAGTAIICHPHPQHGGTMHNKVVTIIERALRELGLATVLFNFRGIGKSEGVYDEGVGETADLAAVAAWVRSERPQDALWLAGFSFGAFVALRGSGSLDPAQLILVAPPVGRWDFRDVAAPTCPWLVVQGEEDEVVDAAAVFDWAESLVPPPHLIRMPETSHFFHRRLMDLRGALKNALAANLPPRREA